MRYFILLICLFLSFGTSTIFAQEELDCSESLHTQVDALYQNYNDSRTEETTISDISAFNEAIDNLLLACSTSATSPEETEVAPTGELTAAQLIEGKWEVIWNTTAFRACPGTEWGTSATNRNFILTVDTATDSFITDDILVWPPLEFIATLEGNYQFLRNIAFNDGTTASYDYRVTLLSSSQIEGTSTYFDPAINCALESVFVMSLVDENIICMIASETGANLRAGAGTEFQRQGTLPAGERTDVIGQARGSDGFVWWQLDSEAWVRSDVVEEAGRCEEVVEVES